jgi:hypothetical protein
MNEPNDFNLPLGSRVYRTILGSFNDQARLVIDRVRSEKRSDIFYAPSELLRPSDPSLIDEMDAFIPEFAGIWEKSGKRLHLEIGLNPDRWRVVSEALRGAIRDSVLDFAVSTQATFRDDLFATYDELKAAIRRDIDEGRLQNGESMPELTKRLMKYFRDSNRARARRIAQTEATRAHHLARVRSAKDAGVVVGWEWRATSASCPVCDAIASDETSPDGLRRVKLGQPFAFVGKIPEYRQIDFPPAHPHCRCTTLPILDAAYSGDPAPIHWSQPLVR